MNFGPPKSTQEAFAIIIGGVTGLTIDAESLIGMGSHILFYDSSHDILTV